MSCRVLCAVLIYFCGGYAYDQYMNACIVNALRAAGTPGALTLEWVMQPIRLMRTILAVLSFWLFCDVPLWLGHFLWSSKGSPAISIYIPLLTSVLTCMAPAPGSSLYLAYAPVAAGILLSCWHMCTSTYKLMKLQSLEPMIDSELKVAELKKASQAVEDKLAAAQALIDAFNADSPEDPAAALLRCRQLLEESRKPSLEG
jgi:hypothetical protein